MRILNLTPRPRPDPALSYVALVMGVLALGFSALFVRWAAAPGSVTAFYRMALAALILTPFTLSRRGKLRTWKRRDLLLATLGGFLMAIDLALWNTSVGLTSAANASLFGNTSLLWVAFAAWLMFGERLSGQFWSGLFVSVAGATAIAGSDFLTHPKLGVGDLLALVGSFFYAWYYLTTQVGREQLDPLSYIWLVAVTSAATLLAICLATAAPLTGFSLQTYLAFLGAAVVTQVIGHLALSYALGHLPASLVAPSMLGQTIVTALAALLLLGEPLSPVQWLGGTAVIAGVFIVHRSYGGKPDRLSNPVPRLIR